MEPSRQEHSEKLGRSLLGRQDNWGLEATKVGIDYPVNLPYYRLEDKWANTVGCSETTSRHSRIWVGRLEATDKYRQVRVGKPTKVDRGIRVGVIQPWAKRRIWRDIRTRANNEWKEISSQREKSTDNICQSIHPLDWWRWTRVLWRSHCWQAQRKMVRVQCKTRWTLCMKTTPTT